MAARVVFVGAKVDGLRAFSEQSLRDAYRQRFADTPPAELVGNGEYGEVAGGVLIDRPEQRESGIPRADRRHEHLLASFEVLAHRGRRDGRGREAFIVDADDLVEIGEGAIAKLHARGRRAAEARPCDRVEKSSHERRGENQSRFSIGSTVVRDGLCVRRNAAVCASGKARRSRGSSCSSIGSKWSMKARSLAKRVGERPTLEPHEQVAVALDRKFRVSGAGARHRVSTPDGAERLARDEVVQRFDPTGAAMRRTGVMAI